MCFEEHTDEILKIPWKPEQDFVRIPEKYYGSDILSTLMYLGLKNILLAENVKIFL